MRWPWHHRHKRRNIAAVPQQLQGIQLQASAVGLAIPLVYGQARVPSRLIHYKKLTLSSGNIFGLPAGLDHPDRSAMAVAICEGPIVGVLQAWSDKDNANSTYLFTAIGSGGGGFTLFLGSLSQTAWSFLTTNYPSEAVPYQLTAYVANDQWPTPSRSVANYSWEVQALLQWGSGIVDANPKDVIFDFLTDANHGLGMASTLIADLTTFRDYCTAAGIFLSPVFDTQRPAYEILQELLALTNSAFVWSDGQLKIVAYGDQNLSGNGATFTANTTPLYNLTDDDFIAEEDEDPLKVTRRPQSDVYNQVRVEFDNRAYQYNGDIAEAKDQNSIELYGLKPAPVIKAPFIKLVSVARLIAQLALQRQVYLRNTYEFKLPLRYALLEPMDLVTLTDSVLGFNQLPVRLLEVTENEDETFSCVAEDWIQGVSTAATYGADSTTGVISPIAFEKIPKMPEVFISFDRAGQAILNLSGDTRTVKHIYAVRSDRFPTLSETRAGTVVLFAGQSNIATGVTVIPGGTVYVGDLAYNSAGLESPLALGAFDREGVGLDPSGRIHRADPFDDGLWGGVSKTNDGMTHHEGSTIGGRKFGAVSRGSLSSLFSDVFDAFSSDSWQTLAGSASVIASNVAQRGSNLLQATGYAQLKFLHPIPFDATKLYRFRVRYRKSADETGGADARVYVGVIALDYTLAAANNNGGANYIMANADSITVASGWITRTAWIKGASLASTTAQNGTNSGAPDAPVPLNTGTVWILPYMLLNYPNTGVPNGTTQVDYFEIVEYDEDGTFRTYSTVASTGNVKRGRAFDDGLYGLQATESDGTTKSSTALNKQGSVLPAPTAQAPFSYVAGGPSNGNMWITWTWSAITLYLADRSTITIGASSGLATPPTPTLSQVAGGALAARTRYVRIAYMKNGVMYHVGGEANLAISANNLLKVTSPASVAGYDGWMALVGSAANGEFLNGAFTAFGTDWTEPTGGVSLTGTPFDVTNMPTGVTAADRASASTYNFYPYYDIAAGFVAFPERGLTSKTASSAATQNADGNIALSAGTMTAITPAAGNSGSGSGGGGRLL